MLSASDYYLLIMNMKKTLTLALMLTMVRGAQDRPKKYGIKSGMEITTEMVEFLENVSVMPQTFDIPKF